MPSKRTYVVLRMNRANGDPVFDYIGEVEATTHHTAKNQAMRDYDLDKVLGHDQGIVLVPERSWHAYPMK